MAPEAKLQGINHVFKVVVLGNTSYVWEYEWDRDMEKSDGGATRSELGKQSLLAHLVGKENVQDHFWM